METITQIFGLETITLAEKKIDAMPVPFGVKSTPEEERVDLRILEDAYINDAAINSGINKLVSVIMSGKYIITGSDKSVSYMTNFLDKVGTRGGNTEWRRLLELTLKHQCVYGRAYNEIIYDSSQKSILDLDFVDPKKMDYAKNSSNKIMLDNFSNPVGWVEAVPMTETFVKLRSDPAPIGTYLQPNQIFFKPDRIVQYKLYEIGDGFYGVGLIEPVINPSRWKRMMMEAITNVYYNTAFPRTVFIIGDEYHEPTPEMMERTVELLGKSTYKTNFAVPSYVEPTILESKKAEKLKEHLKFFVDEEIMTLGPRAFVTNSGDETARAVLSRQEFLYKLTLKDIISRTTYTVERQIFTKIAKLNNLKDVPKIVWGEINLEELDSKAKRIVDYVGSGLIKPDPKTEKYIRKYEGLPEVEI